MTDATTDTDPMTDAEARASEANDRSGDVPIETDVGAAVEERPAPDDPETVVRADCLDVYYGDEQALDGVSIEIPEHRVTAIVGPSGCGKSTFLRCINRMNDQIDACRVEGDLCFHGANVYAEPVDPVALRRRIGMVFQTPNPFPKTVYENVAYGLRVQGLDDHVDVDERVEQALRDAALWDEVEGKLDESGLALSGGQQQRLCIARAIATDPEVLLMDEPASALDPVATAKIEDLIDDLAGEYTVVIVTHNMQQAARISDRTAVFLTGGELVEVGPTAEIFEDPDDQRVEDYVTGKFG